MTTKHLTLSKMEANRAAKRLMYVVSTGMQWNVSTAEAQLPFGWVLENVEESDFFPCTVARFENVLRNHARTLAKGGN